MTFEMLIHNKGMLLSWRKAFWFRVVGGRLLGSGYGELPSPDGAVQYHIFAVKKIVKILQCEELCC